MSTIDLILHVTAAASAGIAVTCLTILLFSLAEFISIDKQQGNTYIRPLPIFVKIALPFASNLRPVIDSSFEQLKNETDKNLLMAGLADSITAENFIAVRGFWMIMGIAALLFFSFVGRPVNGGVLLIAFFFYPKVWLTTTIKKRHLEILKALPNVLDLLTLSVEAGKDFLTALRDILTRRKSDALGDELGRTFQEIQLGKTRQVALKDLANRVQQPELTAVLNSIIQAEELGVSIGHLLRIQGDQLRNKRFTRAEKLAGEAPVKIILPVVIFIFPAVVIILMGPIILQALKMLSQ
jgi:tight adherence protein C